MVPVTLLHKNTCCSLCFEAFLLWRQNNPILFVCVPYACGEHVYKCVGVCIYMHVCGSQRKILSIFYWYSCYIILIQGLSLNLKFTILARLVAQRTPRIHLSLLPDAGVTGMHIDAWIFVWVLGIWTQTFMLSEQAFLFTEPSTFSFKEF